jgi:hypothetical protein
MDGDVTMAQQSTADDQDRNQRIAARAFDRYLNRGMEPGRDMDDWLEAEREIDSDQSMPANGREHVAVASDEAARMDRTVQGEDPATVADRDRQRQVPRRGRESRANRTTL